MLGTGLQFGFARGEDRFYNPVKARQSMQSTENDRLRRVHSDVAASRPSVVREKLVDLVRREPEKLTETEELKKPVAVPSCEPVVKRLSNLERFLQAITPTVTAQYLSKVVYDFESAEGMQRILYCSNKFCKGSKVLARFSSSCHLERTMRGFRTFDAVFQPYFVLGDLWESFREWSAYGAGVPLMLNENDSVIQYYVPYLSGIQIYAESVKSSAKSRQLREDSDSDFRDSSSDGSSDCEPERRSKYLREWWNLHHLSDEVPHCMGRLSLRDQHIVPQDGFSSDDGELVNSQGYLLFEYLERDPPYSREPLADKILDLAFRFPELMTLRSCDILSSSWISVAWYPIYRIPTGPTLKDHDACFLTYHSLHTPIRGSQGVQIPMVTYPSEMDGIPKMSLPVFGLASYKFKGSLWIPNGGYERQLGNTLSQAAENWLRVLQVSHPDFLFFSRR